MDTDRQTDSQSDYSAHLWVVQLVFDPQQQNTSPLITLVNVYVDLLVFTRIAGTSYTGSGRYWC